MASLLITLVIDIGGLVLVWFALRRMVRRSLEIDGLLAEARKEVRLLTLEINETTDRNVSLVEDRLSSLRDLLSEADRRMGVLKRETGRRRAETEVYNRLGRRVPLAPGLFEAAEAPSGGDPDAEVEAGSLASGEAYVPEGEEEAIPLVLGPRLPEVTAVSSVIPPPSLRERAIELHRKGFSAALIASRLGATVAEIDLLVSLEEGREAAAEGGAELPR